jgi:hypothetical protein
MKHLAYCMAVLTVIITSHANAQELYAEASNLPVVFTKNLLTKETGTGLNARAISILDSNANTKNPVFAGVLSVVVPGLGSFYAGCTGHGVRHLAAVPIIIGVTALGLKGVNKDDGEVEAAELLVLAGGIGLLLVNSVWSVVAAVSDVNEYNRKVSIGRLEFHLALRPLTNSTIGLEIARIRF